MVQHAVGERAFRHDEHHDDGHEECRAHGDDFGCGVHVPPEPALQIDGACTRPAQEVVLHSVLAPAGCRLGDEDDDCEKQPDDDDV